MAAFRPEPLSQAMTGAGLPAMNTAAAMSPDFSFSMASASARCDSHVDAEIVNKDAR